MWLLADEEEVLPKPGVSGVDLGDDGGELLLQSWQQVSLHAHVIEPHPALKPGVPGVMKVHQRKQSTGGKVRCSGLDRGLPTGIEHAQGVGADDQIKSAWVNRAVVALAEQIQVRRDGAEFFLGQGQHIGRDVESGQGGLGKAAGELVEIAAGATTDFQQALRAGLAGDLVH